MRGLLNKRQAQQAGSLRGPPAPRSAPQPAPERPPDLSDLRAQTGLSVSDVSRQYGTKRSRVQGWLKDADSAPLAFVTWLRITSGDLGALSAVWSGWRLHNHKLWAPEEASGYDPQHVTDRHWLLQINAALRARLRQAGIEPHPDASGDPRERVTVTMDPPAPVGPQPRSLRSRPSLGPPVKPGAVSGGELWTTGTAGDDVDATETQPKAETASVLPFMQTTTSGTGAEGDGMQLAGAVLQGGAPAKFRRFLTGNRSALAVSALPISRPDHCILCYILYTC